MARFAILMIVLAMPHSVFGQTKPFTPAELADKVLPSVVSIRGVTTDGQEVGGSGFIIDSSGTIVTNLHVVRGLRAVSVQLKNGDVFDSVRITAYDARRDIARIQIRGFNLPAVTLGNSDLVKTGEPSTLFGNPLGLEWSVTTGIISGVRRLDDEGYQVLQTDAAANPGNSGGPMVDSAGTVIGVVTFKPMLSEGVAFAVPINYVKGFGPVESLSLTELAARLNDEAGAARVKPRTTFPKRWTSLTAGSKWVVRLDGERVYVEREIPIEERGRGEFRSIDVAKNATGLYEGTARIGLACVEGVIEQRVKLCQFEDPVALSLVTPTRIEGKSLVPASGAKLNCGKCTWSKPLVPTPFIWIPE